MGGSDSVVDLNPEKKLAGILAPLFAIRGKNDPGIGDTEALKELIEWSASHGIGVVQILPVNETGNDSSPYNLLSAMAFEPTTIATIPGVLPELEEATYGEILAKHDVKSLREGPVKYAQVKALKNELLLAAHESFQSPHAAQKRVRAYRAFEKEQDWLEDYALYRALLSWNGTEVVTEWPESHRSPEAARRWVTGLDGTSQSKFIHLKNFHAYVQWIAWEQWLGVRACAEKAGVALIGDVPVGVSIYSCDVWSHPENFNLQRSCGAPPEKVFKSDPFTEQWGQNWGFPLYNWDRMSRNNYAWWRKRFRLLMKVFHLMRVDHALGFFRIYSFPWRPEQNEEFVNLSPEEAIKITKGPLPCFVERDDTTEENRKLNELHGETIFKVFLEEVPDHCLIAEDLGEVAPYVRPTLRRLEIPGFKIPQWERNWDRLTPGSEYQRLSLTTFATHDHPPVRTVWEELYRQSQSADEGERNRAIHSMWEYMDFCGHPETKLPQEYTAEIHEKIVKGLFATNAWLAIHMVTDLFGTSERYNVPGLAGDQNWTQRTTVPVEKWNEVRAKDLEMIEKALKETNRSIN